VESEVVLFADFRKPIRFPASFINWLLQLMAVFTPFIRDGMDYQKAWEKNSTRKSRLAGISTAVRRMCGLLFAAIAISSLAKCVILI
jgi:hypothetical protein